MNTQGKAAVATLQSGSRDPERRIPAGGRCFPDAPPLHEVRWRAES